MNASLISLLAIPLAAALIALRAGAGSEAIDTAPLQAWVESQGELRSLSCSFTQEKKLRTLVKPLVARGKIWYRAPDDFRWELGDPPRTILYHSAGRVTMVDVKHRRARIIDAAESEEGGAAAGGYFGLGFPRSWEAFEETFEVLSLEREGEFLSAEVAPRDRKLARGVSRVRFLIEDRSQKLRRLSLDLRDRSTITTTFEDAVRNAEVPAAVFEPELEGFAVREAK